MTTSNPINNLANALLVAKLDFDNVLSVYSGKDGHCCCGCSGKHYYRSNYREEAGKVRGYEVSDDEVSDKMVRKIWNIVMDAAQAGTAEWDDQYREFATAVIGKRQYIVYLRKQPKVVVDTADQDAYAWI